MVYVFGSCELDTSRVELRFVEGMDAVQCGCSPSCWCKRPVLSTFRWVFPFKHRFDDESHSTPTPLG